VVRACVSFDVSDKRESAFDYLATSTFASVVAGILKPLFKQPLVAQLLDANILEELFVEFTRRSIDVHYLFQTVKVLSDCVVVLLNKARIIQCCEPLLDGHVELLPVSMFDLRSHGYL